MAVKHHHRMRPTVKGVDVVGGVYPHRGHFLEPPAIGELRPVFHHFVGIVALCLKSPCFTSRFYWYATFTRSPSARVPQGWAAGSGRQDRSSP